MLGHAELLRDLAQVARLGLVLFCRGARDDFQGADLGEARQSFILDAFGEVGVRLFVAQIIERQDGNAFVGDGGCPGVVGEAVSFPSCFVGKLAASPTVFPRAGAQYLESEQSGCDDC